MYCVRLLTSVFFCTTPLSKKVTVLLADVFNIYVSYEVCVTSLHVKEVVFGLAVKLNMFG